MPLCFLPGTPDAAPSPDERTPHQRRPVRRWHRRGLPDPRNQAPQNQDPEGLPPGPCWEEARDLVSQEVGLRLVLPDGEKRLWAWPQGLEDLVRGHLLLERPLRDPTHPDPAHPEAWSLHPEFPAAFWTAPDARAAPTAAEADSEALPPLLPAGPLIVRATPGEACSENLSAAQPPFFRSPEADSSACPALNPETLLGLMDRFIARPGPWDETGCFHRLGLWRLDAPRPELVHVAEDIGRHNCLDRLAGWLLRQRPRLPAEAFGLLLSARVTASLYAKARRAGFTVLVSRSAVSSAAVDAALTEGVTLVGFCRPREGRFTVFADSRSRFASPKPSLRCPQAAGAVPS